MLLVVLDHLALAACAVDGVLGDPVERALDVEVDVVDVELACVGSEGLLHQAEEGVEPKVGEIGYAQQEVALSTTYTTPLANGIRSSP